MEFERTPGWLVGINIGAKAFHLTSTGSKIGRANWQQSSTFYTHHLAARREH